MKTKEPLVSVIVPVYNVEDYLPRCLDSILDQRYDNLEVILVNDGSTDGSGNICRLYDKKDGRIKLFVQKNKGVASARNLGLRKASGDLICFIDPDDFVELNYLDVLVKAIVRNDGDIAICGYCLVDESGKILRRDSDRFSDKLEVFDQEEAMQELLYQKSVDNSLCWRIFRRETLNNIVFPDGMIFEDYAVMYGILKNAHRILKVDVSLYYYVQRNNSIMHSPFSEKNFDVLEVSKLLYRQIIAERPSLERAMRSRIISACFYLLRSTDMKKYKRQYQDVLRIVRKYRWSVLTDRNAKMKIRFGVLLSYVSIKWIFAIYNFGPIKRKVYMR